jgi:glycosyltransferase involved in cell wall biosynthesis
MRTTALIPVFDNAATVGGVVRACRDAIGDVIVVSDGSTDGSADVAEAAGARVVRLAPNGGKGGAILRGMEEARSLGFTHVIVLDADGQHPPREIPRLLAAAAEAPERIWIGVRRMDGNGAPRVSRRGRAISNFWASLNGWQRCRDVQSGFRVYPIGAVLALRCRERRFAFEMEVLVRASWAGLRLGHLDVDVLYPDEASRVSHFRKGRDNLRFTWLSFATFFGMLARAPLLLARRLTAPRAPSGGARCRRP